MNKGLKDVWGRSFKVGAAVCKETLAYKETDDIIKKHFSSLSIENAMKFGPIHPSEGKYNWEECDLIADYARKNKLDMRGHTFVWHNQNPDWLFLDGNEEVSKNTLYKRLESHIENVVKRYGDIVYSWDVLNEVIDTDKGDENGFRISKWYKICGRDVYEFALKKMREACPNAKLCYNDYNNESGSKMEASLRFLSSLLDSGIPIDCIGIQGHWYYNFPDEKVLRNAIERYSSLGIDIEFTEVDISVYEWSEAREVKDFFKSKPLDRIEEQQKRYYELFTIASEYPAVKNITTWGVADNYTWLDYFPVKDRKNWPLLFDENNIEKTAVTKLLNASVKGSN
ncbi:MAG: endo-1,4-beta-xylanase [Treponema sp.]|nr:endo-1,4-beta-xylanase [Treponema sp.]